MNITKVSYGKTYSLGNYCSERIDLEASISEMETVEDVVQMLKNQCDAIHQKNNPHLYQEQDTDYAIPDFNSKEIFEQMGQIALRPPQATENQPLTQEQKIHNLITQSTSIPELEQYKLLSNNKKYPTLKEAWDKQYEKLTNGL